MHSGRPLLTLLFAGLVGCSTSALPPGSDGQAGGDLEVQDQARPLDRAHLDWPQPRDKGADLVADLDTSDLAQDLLKSDQQPPDLGPPPMHKCKDAKLLKLTAGKVTVTGDTAPLSDEFPTLTCGGAAALAGPQAYYRVSLDGGEVYRITVQPGFNAYFYIFSSLAFCAEKQINKDCASSGATGDLSPKITKGGSHSLLFLVPKAGYYYVAVDSAGAGTSGKFTLSVELDCAKFNDKCNTGVNVGGTCQAKPKTGSCDDEDKCTVQDICTNFGGLGLCKGSAKVCPGNACNTGKCDKTSGLCANIPKAGTCDDGDKCTTGDTCQGGVCKGTPVDCSKLNDTCNTGSCDKTSGTCVAAPRPGTIYCSDGDKCTESDVCVSGVCKGTTKNCPGDACNTGSCDASTGYCTKAFKAGSCSDGDNCTISDTCKSFSGTGVCVGTAKTCPGDACNSATCDKTSGACVKAFKSGACSDGDSCTTGDTCANGAGGLGVCKGAAKTCPGDACNTGSCDKTSGACVKTYKAGFCSDGDNCTVSDTCAKTAGGQGTCKGTAKTCTGDICNSATCDKTSGACVKAFKSGACSDNDLCTFNDSCTKNAAGLGVCKGTAKSCPGDACNTGSCRKDTGGCVKAYKAGFCSDGDNCTVSDTCQKGTGGVGVCKGAAKSCPGDACNTGSCNKSSGACVKTFKLNLCSDGKKCTEMDACQLGSGGVGVCKGTPIPCISDQCNTGTCDESTGACKNKILSGACTDGDTCTVNDVCVNQGGTGTCVGSPKSCPGDACNSGYCQGGKCLKTYIAGNCSDNDLCTTGDSCLVGTGGVGYCKGSAVSCPGDQCNTGQCVASTGQCKLTYKAGACTDGNSCTTNDACALASGGKGYCKPGAYPKDVYEPNNSCGAPTNMGSVSEGSGNWISRSGTISPPGDVDWYRGLGLEAIHGCFLPGSSQPYTVTARVNVPTGRTFEVCVYSGSCSGASGCKTGTGTIYAYAAVKGSCAFNDDTYGYIMVRATDGKPQCQSYTVSFRFH